MLPKLLLLSPLTHVLSCGLWLVQACFDCGVVINLNFILIQSKPITVINRMDQKAWERIIPIQMLFKLENAVSEEIAVGLLASGKAEAKLDCCLEFV